MFSLLLNSAPMLVAINFLLRGKGQKFSKLALFFRSRSRLLAAAIGWLVLNESYSFHQWVAFSVRSPMFSPSMNLVTTSFWPLALIVLIAWLMGPEKRSAKREPPHHAPN
jgi:hypothetical protein